MRRGEERRGEERRGEERRGEKRGGERRGEENKISLGDLVAHAVFALKLQHIFSQVHILRGTHRFALHLQGPLLTQSIPRCLGPHSVEESSIPRALQQRVGEREGRELGPTAMHKTKQAGI